MNDLSPATLPRAVGAAATRAEGGYLPHLHLLRGVAITLVVGAHCWPDFAWGPVGQKLVVTAFDNVTVVFVFISGLLFQYLSPRWRYARYVRHRYATVVLPYLVMSLPAVVMVVWFHHRDGVWPWVYQLPAWQQVLFFLATGKALAPFWFIPMLALFIVASPLFILVDRRGWYPVALALAVPFAVLMGRDWVAGPFNVLSKASFMAAAYLAGMAFGRYRAAGEAWCAAHRGALLAGVAAVSAAIYAGSVPGDPSLVQKLLLAGLLVAWLRDARLPAPVTRALGELARLSFAIYFVHGYVISAVRLIGDRVLLGDASGDQPLFAGSVPGLVLHVAVVLAVSVALIRLGQVVLGRWSRYLIGA